MSTFPTMTDEKYRTYVDGAHHVALSLLVRCLVQNGVLRPGQFEDQLRATLMMEGAETERPDYGTLRVLLEVLEGTEHTLN